MKLLLTLLTLLTLTTAVYAGITISGGTFNPITPTVTLSLETGNLFALETGNVLAL